LAHVERLPDNVRETRRQEYASLVDALVAEIGDALSQSNVVMLRRWGETKPKPQ
jgi:nucleoid DNA-binding protein